MYLLKMFFSNSCFIIFKWEKVVFTTIALYVGGGGGGLFCMCFPLSFHSILLSFYSCLFMDSLCPFDHLYVSLVKLYSFLCPMSIMTKGGENVVFRC